MLFQPLTPLVTERPVHLLLSAADGTMRVYIEPKAKEGKDKAPAVALVPFSVCDTPPVLDNGFAAAVGDWIAARATALGAEPPERAISEADSAVFEALHPLITERPVHLLLSAEEDGKMRVFIEAKAKDGKAQGAALAPFSVCDTPQALDEGFAAAFGDWIAARAAGASGLKAGLDAGKASLAAAAEKDKEEKAKSAAKPASNTTKTKATVKKNTKAAKKPVVTKPKTSKRLAAPKATLKAPAKKKTASPPPQPKEAPAPAMVIPRNIGPVGGGADAYPLAVGPVASGSTTTPGDKPEQPEDE